MRIQINDQWRVESDERCWQVQKYLGTYKSGKHVGKPKWRAMGYYATLPQAVDALAQRLLRDSEASTATEAVDAAKRIVNEIGLALAELRGIGVIRVEALQGNDDG